MKNMNKYDKYEQYEPHIWQGPSNDKSIFSDRTALEKRFWPSKLLMVLSTPSQKHVPSENQILLSFLKDNLFKTLIIFKNSDFSAYLLFNDPGIKR